MTVVMIDNHDSFTYNLVHYLGELGAAVVVVQSDAVTLAELDRLEPQGLVISPGPCTPNEAGISMAAITHFAGRVPILGVCLGHQCIGQVFGAEVVRAGQVMHGKTSVIEHTGLGLFADLPERFTVTRYHSLLLRPNSLPDCLEVTAQVVRPDGVAGEIMGVRHRSLPIEGVQFHPESILTEQGHPLLANFLRQCQPDRPDRRIAI
ncbi:MAG: anthranilate synthase component II [Saccharospirillum sp.]